MSHLSWSLPPLVPTAPVSAGDDATRDLFGKDILFLDDFQMTGAGDYALVEGKENLRRAIYRRLLTRPGEYMFRPDYGAGLATFVKRVMTQANLDTMRQLIIDQLARDPRIESVLEVSVSSTLHGQSPVVKVYVKARVLGQEHRFEPLSFTEEA
jgi:phage baseplate assembly protein W